SQVTNEGPSFTGGNVIHLDRSARLLHHAAENLKDRSLAGAVRAYQSEDFSRSDIEVDAFHRFEVAVALAQVANADGNLGLIHFSCKGLKRRYDSGSVSLGD